jgi:hypothetical protein
LLPVEVAALADVFAAAVLAAALAAVKGVFGKPPPAAGTDTRRF